MEKEEEIIRLLEDSISRSIVGEKSVGLIFSAGVDSTLVGVLACKFTSVSAYNVGISGSVDMEYAKKVENDLRFKVNFVEVCEEEIEKTLPVVLKAIGEPNPLKVAVGLPFYFASKAARRDGFSVMLCGQGPDEMFGGYARYLTDVRGESFPGVAQSMREDVANIYESQLQYDERVCKLNNMTLKFPFLNKDLVEYVSKIPIEEKIRVVEGKADYDCVDDVGELKVIRKFILREAAKSVGVPDLILNRPKKAAQYGSGTSKVIEKLARKRGYKKKALDEGRTDYVRYYIESIFR
ncbi:MAG: asparagine synthase-related protein [Methanobacteriota archaeon]